MRRRLNPPESVGLLALASVVEQGITFESGIPVTFRALRNTQKSPYLGSKFQQDIEPHGRYMIHNEAPGEIARGWETEIVSFKMPLVLQFTLDPQSQYGPTSWKQRLVEHFRAKGRALTFKIKAAGFDSIVTVSSYTHAGKVYHDTREIVDLRVLKNPPAHSHPIISKPITEPQFVAEFSAVLLRGPHWIRRSPTPRIFFSEKLQKLHCRNPRRYAEVDVVKRQFFFAPQVRWLPREHRRGLIAHEIGHVLFPSGSEQEADDAALEYLGVEILYDKRWRGVGLQVGRFVR